MKSNDFVLIMERQMHVLFLWLTIFFFFFRGQVCCACMSLLAQQCPFLAKLHFGRLQSFFSSLPTDSESRNSFNARYQPRQQPTEHSWVVFKDWTVALGIWPVRPACTAFLYFFSFNVQEKDQSSAKSMFDELLPLATVCESCCEASDTRQKADHSKRLVVAARKHCVLTSFRACASNHSCSSVSEPSYLRLRSCRSKLFIA